MPAPELEIFDDDRIVVGDDDGLALEARPGLRADNVLLSGCFWRTAWG